MEEELTYLDAADEDVLDAELADDDALAGKKKGDENGIIAILIG
jgi:hypothetical protein